MVVEDAWGALETVVPRLDRTLIKVLIASFACAQETRAGLLPILFVSGPTGVGKTAMAQVAAGIMGARIGAEATFNEDSAKFRQAIFEGGQQGPVVVLNELLKDATRGRFRLTIRESLDFVLNLTPNSSSWVSYRGPVKMGRLPAIMITETSCPETLREESQLARRIRHHYVAGRKEEWKVTIAKAGLTDLHLIRTVSDHIARACDAIMSEVVDECFAVPQPWDQIADSLGVLPIEKSEEFEDPEPWLRELFRLTCAAPELSERDKKLYADGYKKISRIDGPGEEDALCSVYSKFADGTGRDWASSRRLLEKDWADVLKTDHAVKLDLKGDTTGVYLRFRVGPPKKPTAVNAQIVDPSAWEGLF